MSNFNANSVGSAEDDVIIINNHKKTDEQYVINSKGEKEPVDLRKIIDNIEGHAKGLRVRAFEISQAVIANFKPGVKTSELRLEAVRQCVIKPTENQDYKILARRLFLSNLRHITPAKFSDAMEVLHAYGTMNDEFSGFVAANRERLDAMIKEENDHLLAMLGLSTYCKVYMLKKSEDAVERPQYTFLRVAVGLYYPKVHLPICKCDICVPHVHKYNPGAPNRGFDVECIDCYKRMVALDNETKEFEEKTTFGEATESILKEIEECYNDLSMLRYMPASPTLFNMGTKCQQLSSCFLNQIKADSIKGIYQTNADNARISQSGAGIGNHVSNIRASGSRIVTTNGKSNGLVPMLKTYNSTALQIGGASVYDDDERTSNNLPMALKEYNDTARYVDQCFTPETIVYTREGPKQIKSVTTFDEVLCREGHFDKVTQVVRHDVDKELLVISLRSGQQVRVTKEHQVLAVKGGAKLTQELLTHKLEKKMIEMAFADVCELGLDDLLVFPVPSFTQDLTTFYPEDCRFYGILMAAKLTEKSAQLYLPYDQTETINFVKKYLEERNLKFVFDEIGKNHCVSFEWMTLGARFKFTNEMFEDSRGNPRIQPELLHLPMNKVNQLLKGLLESCGAVKPKFVGLSEDMLGEQVLHQIHYILLRNEIFANAVILPIIKGIEIPRVQVICDLFPENTVELDKEVPFYTYTKYHENSLADYFGVSGSDLAPDCYVLVKIAKKATEQYKGLVYDFEVGDPESKKGHTYSSEIGIAHNGGGKRKGAFAIYIEPWHADFLDVMNMKLPEGPPETRAPDLYFAMWNNNVFMRRLGESQRGKVPVPWSFFCPKSAPGLMESYGEKFEVLYLAYEATPGLAKGKMDIWTVWQHILTLLQKTGGPYILQKDNANARNNQEHMGTLTGSNLCTEIMEYTGDGEIACCNLSSVILDLCVFKGTDGKWHFDHNQLIALAGKQVRNLNNVIDRTRYPVPEARFSNLKHRPMAIGVQGLANLFHRLGIAYDSLEAQELNHRIFEDLYYGALKMSIQIAKELGKTYESYAIERNGIKGSKLSRGILVFDDVKRPAVCNNSVFPEDGAYFDSYDKDGNVKLYLPGWDELRADLAKYGCYNSLLLGPMPTATVSKFTGRNECTEPIFSNIFQWQTLVGNTETVNTALIEELEEIGLWTPEMFSNIIGNEGSIQNIPEIPDDIKRRHKTVTEIPAKKLMLMGHARGLFVDQSLSYNVYIDETKVGDIHRIQVLGHELGMKTVSYYLTVMAKKSNMAVPATNVPVNVTPVSEEKPKPRPRREAKKSDEGCQEFCQ